MFPEPIHPVATQAQPDTFDFSTALRRLKAGARVRLVGWPASDYVARQIPDAHSKMSAPYLYASREGRLVPWLPSQTDLDAFWCIAE